MFTQRSSVVEVNGQHLSLRQRDARPYISGSYNDSKLRILGNPNVGKTSLFNALTGSYEYR